MRFIAIAALLIAFNASAVEFVTKTFKHTDSGIDGFSRNYYNCDWAEKTVESHLEKLGASNITVNCTGGIEHDISWGMWPVSIVAKFDVPADRTMTENVVLKSSNRADSACYFHTKLLNKLLATLVHVTVNSKKTNCMDNSSRWSYDLSVAQ